MEPLRGIKLNSQSGACTGSESGPIAIVFGRVKIERVRKGDMRVIGIGSVGGGGAVRARDAGGGIYGPAGSTIPGKMVIGRGHLESPAQFLDFPCVAAPSEGVRECV